MQDSANIFDHATPDGQFPTVKRSRFADQAYTYLFQKIVTGAYREGDKLPSENEMSMMFGVSRPVVREALERLRAEGLVASRRGRGSIVQPRPTGNGLATINADKLRVLRENLEFRALLEPQACIYACERRTDEDIAAIRAAVDQYQKVAVEEGAVGAHLDFSFHLAVAKAAHNARFVDAIRMVEYDIDHGVNLVRFMARFDHLERSRSVLAEHTRVLNAIERRDAATAALEMHRHLEQARTRMENSNPKLDPSPGEV
jgi:DNA-binding FadR family transcriptional regulator